MNNFPDYNIILASNSPRRKDLLVGLEMKFEVKVLPDIDESFPMQMPKRDVAAYIAIKKGVSHSHLLKENDLLITADTTVLLENEIYGKPVDLDDAKRMLHNLSGKTHEVITGVCLTTQQKQHSFSVSSQVRFASLDESEINHYVEKYRPLDKAGAYGIQEWIGYIAVEHISGSYFNIMGLPVQRLYKELRHFQTL